MDSTPVKVNVGGVVFSTTRSTLQKARYFSELALEPDLSNVMIDRNPRTFEYLLDCLRDRRYITAERLQEYQYEIDYYGMDCLKAEAEELIPIITVADDSPFRIKCWHGVPFVQPKQDLQLTPEENLELKIFVRLPYPGYIEIKSIGDYTQRLTGYGPEKSLKITIRKSVKPQILPAGQDLCYFVFHRNPLVKVQ